MAQEDLRAIRRDLEALRDDARARMNTTANRDESDRLFLQILEINHRLQMINAIFFDDATRDLSERVKNIAAATEQVRSAIASLDRLAEAINGIKSLLGLVDTVIDILT